MLRTALKPRWLSLFVLLVAIIVTFTQLGLWQLHVAQDKGLVDALRKAHEARPVLIDAVIRPHVPFPNPQSGRAVTAAGTYAGGQQLLVGPRRLQGRTGYWVLTPLDVRETGARLAVVRGFVTDPTHPLAAPTGPVSVDGSLAPGESPGPQAPRVPGWPQEPLGSVDLSVLVNRWSGDLYNAFVFAQTERSADGTAIASPPGLQRVPPPEVTAGLKWRNAAYALQWWLFAGFAAFMWFRMVRDDAARDSSEPREPAAAVPEESTA
ncbi:SURF1 family protein [Pedococcus sp. 5OH_020]|uniref:SURF1 family protein n=1 Tax=Pedococcus sp. 5OH_020 TaxID=2989814 RepID=UPI0022E9AFC1|nr:SURF1 family protein [Pedococcus sp. 5OH_020]